MLKKWDNIIVEYVREWLGDNSTSFYWLHHFWEKGADPRTQDYPLVGLSGLGFFTQVVLLYLGIVFVVIPEYLRKKPALTLTRTMIIYNIIVVIRTDIVDFA